MAQPPPAAPPVIDYNMWLSCAAPYSGWLPPVGSLVYYFPQGHAEQCNACAAHLLPDCHRVLCTVTDLDLNVDAETDELYAIITLRPGNHRVPYRHHPQRVAVPGQRTFSFFAKLLSLSDVTNDALIFPMFGAEDHALPRIDSSAAAAASSTADPPAENLLVTDLRGRRWEFGAYISSDTDRCHKYTAGWRAFVEAKRLSPGDTVIFMRIPSGERFVGVRRKPYGGIPVGVPVDKVVDAAGIAVRGLEFSATYYPRQGTEEFVVPYKEVEDSLKRGPLAPGTTVHLLMNPGDGRRRTEPVDGTVVRAVDSLSQRAWRTLEVEWDRSSPLSSTMNRQVSPWQVRPIQFAPPESSDEAAATTSTTTGGDAIASATTSAPSSAPPQAPTMAPTLPASQSSSSTRPSFTMMPQLPRATIPSPGSAFRIVNPRHGSPANNSAASVVLPSDDNPHETRRTRLSQGTTQAVPNATGTDGASSSQQANQVSDGAADASATPDLDSQRPQPK